MKGFLIKDCQLFLAQKNFLMIVPIGLIFMITNENPVFGISYIIYLTAFLGISLIAYDTFDNGMVYLMTLPGGRKNYVSGKYLFSLISTSLCTILLMGIGSVVELAKGRGMSAVWELIGGTGALFAMALIFISIMLPIQLKYGPEKSRIVLLIAFGIIFLGGSFLGYLGKTFNLDPSPLFHQLNQISFSRVTMSLLLLTVVVMGISWVVSQKIMKEKNF